MPAPGRSPRSDTSYGWRCTLGVVRTSRARVRVGVRESVGRGAPAESMPTVREHHNGRRFGTGGTAGYHERSLELLAPSGLKRKHCLRVGSGRGCHGASWGSDRQRARGSRCPDLHPSVVCRLLSVCGWPSETDAMRCCRLFSTILPSESVTKLTKCSDTQRKGLCPPSRRASGGLLPKLVPRNSRGFVV